MVKLEDWDKRLSHYLQQQKKAPFKWGENDCILFAAKAYEAMTGINHYQKYLGYENEEQARDILEAHNGLDGAISKFLGPGHRNPMLAKRGDIVLLKLKQLTCGVVDDSGQKVAAPGIDGIIRYPLKLAWRIWSVD